MKKYGKYLIAAVAGLVFFAACDNYEADDHKFGNAVYLDVAETNEVQLTTFGNNKPTYDCALQAELTYPAGQHVGKTGSTGGCGGAQLCDKQAVCFQASLNVVYLIK